MFCVFLDSNKEESLEAGLAKLLTVAAKLVRQINYLLCNKDLQNVPLGMNSSDLS